MGCGCQETPNHGGRLQVTLGMMSAFGLKDGEMVIMGNVQTGDKTLGNEFI